MRGLLILIALAGCNDRSLPSTPGGGDLGRTADLALVDLAAISCSTVAANCPPGFYCEAFQCAGDNSGGTCQSRPSDCTGANGKQPECGCDGHTYANSCLRAQAAVSLAHAGSCSQNACEQAFGYCAPGDFVEPTCKNGFTKSPAITATGVCGLGICCVPLGV